MRATQSFAEYVRGQPGSLRLFEETAAAQRSDAPGPRRWRTWWNFSLALAAAVAVGSVVMDELAPTSRATAGTQAAARAPALAAAGDAPSGLRERRVEPPEAPAPAIAAAVNAAPAPNPGGPAPSAQAPAAEPLVLRADLEAPPQRASPARPAPNRSLCSAASEAAGLCNPG